MASSHRAGVGALVGVVQAGGGQVRVDLRGGQRLVAEQFLHAAQVRAVVQQVRGEAVPQRVRADGRIEAGFARYLSSLRRTERVLTGGRRAC